MSAIVLPLPTVVFQVLFLLMAIALEAIVFQKQLEINRKTSIEYSASLNLFSTIIGWLTFFLIQPMLSRDLKVQLINYIFFTKFLDYSMLSIGLLNMEISLIVILWFLLAFLVEYLGFIMLDQIRMNPAIPKIKEPPLKKGLKALTHTLKHPSDQPQIYPVTVILHANALSYSLISLILLFRLVYFNQ